MADDLACPVPDCDGKIDRLGNQHSTGTIGRKGVRDDNFRSQTGRCTTCGTRSRARRVAAAGS